MVIIAKILQPLVILVITYCRVLIKDCGMAPDAEIEVQGYISYFKSVITFWQICLISRFQKFDNLYLLCIQSNLVLNNWTKSLYIFRLFLHYYLFPDSPEFGDVAEIIPVGWQLCDATELDIYTRSGMGHDQPRVTAGGGRCGRRQRQRGELQSLERDKLHHSLLLPQAGRPTGYLGRVDGRHTSPGGEGTPLHSHTTTWSPSTPPHSLYPPLLPGIYNIRPLHLSPQYNPLT